MVFYELLTISQYHVMGLGGVMLFVVVHLLLSLRFIGGDGLLFFSGNTVAAALVLSSNFAGVHVLWLLAQIVGIAAAMTVMIALFFREEKT